MSFFRSSEFRFAAVTTVIATILHPAIIAGLRALDERAPFTMDEMLAIAMRDTPVYALTFGALMTGFGFLKWSRGAKETGK